MQLLFQYLKESQKVQNLIITLKKTEKYIFFWNPQIFLPSTLING